MRKDITFMKMDKDIKGKSTVGWRKAMGNIIISLGTIMKGSGSKD